jgi:hypothetical protein
VLVRVVLAGIGVLLNSQVVNAQESGGAVFRGKVSTDSSRHAVPQAEITIVEAQLSVRSDSNGRFFLGRLPSGTFTVQVRHPAYRAINGSVRLSAGDTVTWDFDLIALTSRLAEVRVEERSPLSIGMAGFEERRRAKIGKFIGPEVLEKYMGPTLSGLIANKIPGFDVVPLITHGYMSGGFGIASRHYQSMRGGVQNQLCFAKLIVNGARLSGLSGAPTNIDELKPGEVVGMEFYRGASEVPTEFSGPDAACGVVVIWTKQR